MGLIAIYNCLCRINCDEYNVGDDDGLEMNVIDLKFNSGAKIVALLVPSFCKIS